VKLQISWSFINSEGGSDQSQPFILLRMFSRRWLLATILVLIGSAVMVRLGIWQLDRLEQRRAFNTRVMAQIDQPALDMNQSGAPAASLVDMEYRSVSVKGTYDYEHQVVLRNQAYQNQWGVNLLTPLKISGRDQAILVNRGWIPADDYEGGDWSKYSVMGAVQVEGMIRRSESQPDFGFRSDPTPQPGMGPLKSWNFVNIPRIDEQTPYDLLPVYIQQAPVSGQNAPPYASLPEFELSEGPHMGYAIQWFTFAALLAFGYPFYIRKQEKSPSHE
jgi:surfeit locus 1 family protein